MCNEDYTIVEQVGKTGSSVIYMAEKQEGKWKKKIALKKIIVDDLTVG